MITGKKLFSGKCEVCGKNFRSKDPTAVACRRCLAEESDVGQLPERELDLSRQHRRRDSPPPDTGMHITKRP